MPIAEECFISTIYTSALSTSLPLKVYPTYRKLVTHGRLKYFLIGKLFGGKEGEEEKCL